MKFEYISPQVTQEAFIQNNFFLENPQKCIFCEETSICISLDNDFVFTEWEQLDEKMDRDCVSYEAMEANRIFKENEYGCLDCLKNGVYRFAHYTELGSIRKNGFNQHVPGNPTLSEEIVFKTFPLPSGFSEGSIDQLSRTPPTPYWQEENWLIHCNDFMVFQGIWEPEDFEKNSNDGHGVTLFKEMVGDSWDTYIGTDVDNPYLSDLLEGWLMRSFKCKHCTKLRAFGDIG